MEVEEKRGGRGGVNIDRKYDGCWRIMICQVEEGYCNCCYHHHQHTILIMRSPPLTCP